MVNSESYKPTSKVILIHDSRKKVMPAVMLNVNNM